MKYLIITAIFNLFLSCQNTGAAPKTTSENTAPTQVQQEAKVIDIKQDEFDKMKDDDNVVVIDVRTAGEVSQGYIDGADVFLDYNGGQFSEALPKLEHDKTYLIYCRSGGRSSNAANEMVNAGFVNVYNLLGGISNYSGKTVQQ